ncbi:hypothetical protein PDIG_88170 [Penicillium digitatum PHI26]|uniref:Uncharacterized protein n=2 Tax=Penicillium digitatum TaxID=36651 RepID=K9F5M2_PEND2|nr:hypothetical protein PDIP_34190 [Penicillium digitatum Pd1]EKV04650.1 hypothetical protein PDIG_88170 [Penicillium digitatum PHI26]EKV16831.1 hypothetical protein PDIP_34190 [Penicillium digitatum Pd1]
MVQGFSKKFSVPNYAGISIVKRSKQQDCNEAEIGKPDCKLRPSKS